MGSFLSVSDKVCPTEVFNESLLHLTKILSVIYIIRGDIMSNKEAPLEGLTEQGHGGFIGRTVSSTGLCSTRVLFRP
jgi:hypothetical protein